MLSRCLVHSKFADTFVLKGGVLLAALDARRPTRDIDFAVRAIENTTEKVLSAVQTIAAMKESSGFNSHPARTNHPPEASLAQGMATCS